MTDTMGQEGSVLDMLGKAITISEGRDGHLTFGPLDLWIRRQRGEWHVASFQESDLESRAAYWEEGTAPHDAAWERWIVGGASRSIVIRPLPPDRPIVVRPEMPVCLGPGQSTHFFIGLPLWVEVSAGSPTASEVLCDLPSIRLSNTWFGTPQEGELCYAMRTHAHRHAADLLDRQHRCICPLQVRNSSQEVLSFERICVRCQHLHVYRGPDRFWSNVVRLSYRGRQEWSRVIYGRNPPEGSEATEVVAEPRKRVSRGFNLQSFQSGGLIGGMA